MRMLITADTEPHLLRFVDVRNIYFWFGEYLGLSVLVTYFEEGKDRQMSMNNQFMAEQLCRVKRK